MPLVESAISAPHLRRTLRLSEDRHLGRTHGSPTPDLVVTLPASHKLSRTAGLRDMVFPCLWVFIGLVSAVDVYLTVYHQEHLLYLEQNPLGRMLLRVHGWEPSLLIGAKFFGSTMVLGLLTAIYVRDRRMGLVVSAALATFQLGLLGYLVLG